MTKAPAKQASGETEREKAVLQSWALNFLEKHSHTNGMLLNAYFYNET